MGVTKVFSQTHSTTGTKPAIVVNGKARVSIFGASTSGQSGNYFRPFMQLQPGGAWYPVPESVDGSGGGAQSLDDTGASVGNVYTYDTPHGVYAIRLYIQRLAFTSLRMEVTVVEPTSISQVA